MLFHTPEFILLLIVTLICYYLWPKWRLLILAWADVLFYAAAGIGFLFLFTAVTTVTYGLSLQLRGRYKKPILGLAIFINVANLMFFKYSIFLLSSLEKVLPIQLLNNHPIFMKLILPIGISFYTFQFIAYLVDVYQEKIEPARNLLIFWVFISFFAHLIAGPIMRGKDLIPQMEMLQKISFSPTTFKLGMSYLALGLAKKILLADYIATYADKFFNQGAFLTGTQSWVGAYLFAFQIFYDFSAYSEMAVGIAYLFGIKLDLNFKTPYLSHNPSEFWRRWHITLSNWIRDYIYIPLGGSRQGKFRKYLNLFIAMAVSGFWHGAAWTFVAWGMYHGLLLILHNLYTNFIRRTGLNKFTSSSIVCRGLSIVVFFHLACIGWVFFRADSFSIAGHMIAGMLTIKPWLMEPYLYKYLAVIAGLYLLHILEYQIRKYYLPIIKWWEQHLPVPFRAIAYAAFIVILVLCSQAGQSNFIYFQF